MQQLSGLDSAFIHQDSSRTPMHISAVLLYDAGPQGHFAISREKLIEMCQQRLSSFPLVHRKIQRLPMGIDKPYWLDVQLPDWQAHISEMSIANAGDWRALQDALANLHQRRMNLHKPLWELHLLHGLSGLPGLPPNCQALVLKIHHAAIDGIAMAQLIDALHREPTPGGGDRGATLGKPGALELWNRVNFNRIGRQIKLAETMGNLLPGVARARQARREFTDLPALLNKGAVFNSRVRSRRSTGAVLLSRDAVLGVKRAVGKVTLNDIALACVAGALRRYLQEHERVPAKSLASGVPINLRTPKQQKTDGNQIATMIVGLATHIDDPVARLRMIHRYAVAGKKQITALGTGTVMDISDSVSPALLAEGIRTMAWASQLAEVPVPFHTMVSNVPGPALPMHLGEARLVVPIGLGPVRDNMGLFHIISNSDTMISLSFTACARLLPDPEFYEACLAEAFAELTTAAREIHAV